MVTVLPTSSGLSWVTASKTCFQPDSHHPMTSWRVVAAWMMNSWSRLRSGFSPSLVRKSVKRERMLPARCFTMIAMLFASGSRVTKNSSSRSWESAPSANRLVPRKFRNASSRNAAATLSVAIVSYPLIVIRSAWFRFFGVQSKSTTARRLDANALTRLQANAELAWHSLHRAVLPDDFGLAQTSFIAAGQPIGSALSPIAEERDIGVGENFDLTNDPVPTSVLAVAAGSSLERISPDAQRIRVFQRFCGCVEGIGHVGVHSGNAFLCRTRSHAARNSFVICERLHGPRRDSADREVVHGAGSGSGNLCWYGVRKSLQQYVYDTLRCLNVPSGNRRRWTRVHHGAFGREHLDGPHQARRRGHVFRQQAAENVEACGIGDCLYRIDTALHLRIA